MCESEVYVKNKGKLEKIMDEVVFIDVKQNKIFLSKMFDESKELEGYKVISIDLLNHKIILEKT